MALKSWKKDGEEIILVGDFNDNIYTIHFAQIRIHRNVGLVEQYHKLFGEEAPFSHASGLTPIMGVFTTAGVEVTKALLSQHKVKSTVGNHRLHVFLDREPHRH